ncbi:Chitobiosyldiphosphodolichol beta-mannosyltransferase, family GT33 [Chondrus crispus]|uniref:Chitobiosyldiphosphodolichol beta-mannosyltransferase, family GT33 n=1 Tax=Chondrus crispus TaxID=2769 RepID=R7QBB0_CHOCR|nr:Chitobiosyldiphosphodolichol beta-mannosyltransferase, family GT33 [Chondrus crispus]CDF35802.1 Chitobiosyldiphosphodolichol beta-mannosyltransferase, family GT33 [Chondrus crispus]|eukprot:XP_005715621.1 Chitobiosyldiphosphodolichol beta-mannosyltransferase, family GT33 [Chondrus crispus]
MRSAPPRARLLDGTRAVAAVYGASVDAGAVPLVVSSTSWTADEDFSPLLAALRAMDARGEELLVVITGKGPLRSGFEEQLREADLRHIGVWLAWLPYDDYPRLLGCASVGVSMHQSSSGLDLPMKVVDMLAVGTPVLARRFACIGELVLDGITGLLFDDARELEELLRKCVWGGAAARMREQVKQRFAREEMQWQHGWERCAMPTLALGAAQRP